MDSFGCPLCCRQKFDSIKAVREHLLYFIYRPLICVFCSMSIDGICELTRHLETHINYNSDGVSNFDICCDKQPVELLLDQYELQEEPSTSAVSQQPFKEGQSSEIGNDSPLEVLNYENQSVESQVLFTNQSNSETIPSNTESEDSLSCSFSETGWDDNWPDELSRQTSESNHSRGDSGETVRAFVCKICGVKVVGKDSYFTHLQQNCLPNKNVFSSEQDQRKEGDVDVQKKKENCYFSVLSSNYIGSCSYNKENGEKVNSHKQHNSNYKFKSDYTLTELTNVTHSSFTAGTAKTSCDKENFSKELQREKRFAPFGNGLSSSHLQPPSQAHTKPKSPLQSYFHKKFDHDQDRKPENAFSKNDVQCCIQNFQSLLVNKLNQAFESNPVFNFLPNEDITEDTKKVDDQEENGEEEEVEEEELEQEKEHQSNAADTSSEKTVKYDCRYCSKSYNYKQSRDNHERSHTSKNTMKCEQCHKVFIKRSLLCRHVHEIHSGMMFICNLCDRQFKSRRTLVNHKGFHEKKRFGCSLCSYVCHTGSGLRTHVFETHSPKTKEIVCPDCGEQFKKKYGLQRHIERKHRTDNFSCRYCDKNFSCKEDLNHHLNTHLDNKSLTCTTCDQIFTTLSSLKRHSAKHKKESNSYMCEKCSAVFTRKDSLVSHSKLHTSARMYICKCGKGFNKESQLKYHSAKHSSTAQFSCKRCDKSYKFKVSLRNHICKEDSKVS